MCVACPVQSVGQSGGSPVDRVRPLPPSAGRPRVGTLGSIPPLVDLREVLHQVPQDGHVQLVNGKWLRILDGCWVACENCRQPMEYRRVFRLSGAVEFLERHECPRSRSASASRREQRGVDRQPRRRTVAERLAEGFAMIAQAGDGLGDD